MRSVSTCVRHSGVRLENVKIFRTPTPTPNRYAEAKALLRKQKIKERKKRGEKNVGVGSHRMTRKKRRNRMAEREVMKDEQVSRKVGRLGGKIRVAKRKEREEEVALEGKRKRKKVKKKKKKRVMSET